MSDGQTKTPGSAKQIAEKKWGKSLSAGGFQIVPNLLFRTQHHLGLTANDLVVLLNINVHWWTRDELPFPAPAIIADRMGVSKRTVERILQGLESKGFVERLPPQKVGKSGRQIRRISLQGLVSKLTEASEWSVAAKEYRRKQTQQRRKGTPGNERAASSGTPERSGLSAEFSG